MLELMSQTSFHYQCCVNNHAKMLVPNGEIFREIVIEPHSSDWINKDTQGV